MTARLRIRDWTAVALLTATITACAPRADAIAPVSMAGAFAGTPCAAAAAMLNYERPHLASLSASQNGAATGDAVGVLLLGLPVGSAFGGDKQGEIAASKGKILALEDRLRGCNVAMAG